MNGKRAKQLRRAAREMTVGESGTDYHQHRHYKDTKQLKETCTKSAHKRLKRGYKQATK